GSPSPFAGKLRGDEGVRPSTALTLLLLLALALVAGLALPRPAYAEDPLAAKELQVEQQLGCPICTNLPLNVCDNQLCQEMRGVIHQKLSAGDTPDQIVAYFVARYGDAVLLSPPREGFSLAAWYLPFLALALGVMILLTFLRRSLRRRRVVERRFRSEDPALDRYRQQVRRDLEKLEDSR
ncbi:MAG: cytochrome c-type biogenesis protein, partial [Candidatus Dormibacteraceae bacterium]